MARNLIKTMYVPHHYDHLPDIIRECTDKMAEYAHRIGAEYHFSQERIYQYAVDQELPPYFDVGWVFDQTEYDNIVYVDADVCPRKDLEINVFDVVGHMGDPHPGYWKHNWIHKRIHRDKLFVYPDVMGTNGGIYKLSRDEWTKMKPSWLWALNEIVDPEIISHEEYAMHLAFGHSGVTPIDMGWQWNYVGKSLQRFPIAQGNFYHFAGEQRYQIYEAVRDYI